MFDHFDFESDRLTVSRLTKGDAAALFQLYADKEAMKFRGSKAMTDMGDAFKMIEEQFITDNHISKWRLGIKRRSDDSLLGTLLFVHDKNRGSNCEIGFSIGSEHWGKGYGQEILEMMTKKLKTAARIDEMSAWCIKENRASVRIFEKAGFSEIQQNEYPESKLFTKQIK